MRAIRVTAAACGICAGLFTLLDEAEACCACAGCKGEKGVEGIYCEECNIRALISIADRLKKSAETEAVAYLEKVTEYATESDYLNVRLTDLLSDKEASE